MPITCPRCHTSNRDGARFCSRCAFPFKMQAQTALGLILQNRFRLTRVLGEGGMGAVYLAEHLNLGQHFAIKEMLDQFLDPAEHAQALAQFQAEARMLVRLSHHNLPRVHDLFDEGGRHYLVMDFVDGETLQQRLDRTAGFCAEPDALNWAGQICDVLDYLHSQNPPIVFRDLKPANVMLARSGVVKLIDFGIARLFNPAKSTDTFKMGSVWYAPPEQYGGKGQTTPQSDIYALGATLHHLLTRRDPSAQPFIFPALRAINPAISPNTDAVVFKALDYDPAKRFARAGEMKAALFGQQAQMVTCPRCGQRNLANEVYCQHCSAQLAAHRTCPHCQRPTPGNALYCAEFGRKL